ncbi:MAG: DRTGG domain-containing protein [Desulfomonilia bacterium]|jgi:predicted transcriptional regulator|uniref:DRTGG domain protein n=1 Tax=anaerobic digester metagenome TaxID=1263854 RepID=A0A485M2D8_9ZZZZ|nr:DRTGG domain-containing protein [Pseudomonadota bacterium]HON39621.1 DRTGG domain-containing protein [Deltaproteobacteria bacterium]HRS57376.1 DRTGG domain-containing protein [Desulfomonilia bacterium]HPD22596.1 DRTGG domain-containing protein [Deltaproteobacteria bacterium]HPW69613.1 DRTGG domain-containing protein [Deltaproteobacteria bacterium]
MTLAEIKDLLDADIVVGEEMLNMEVSTGFAADLMSDVLAFAKEGSILLTGLTNPLVVRTAETLDLRAIIFVRGKRPSPDAVKLAKEKNIPLLGTRFILFESCGRLFSAGMRGSIQKVGEAS